MVPSTDALYCIEKWCLLMQFMSAAVEYFQLQTTQLRDVVAEKPLPTNSEIESARHRKDEARQAIMDHSKRTARAWFS